MEMGILSLKTVIPENFPFWTSVIGHGVLAHMEGTGHIDFSRFETT